MWPQCTPGVDRLAEIAVRPWYFYSTCISNVRGKLDLQIWRSLASKGKDGCVFATCRTLAADWVASGGSSSCDAAEILFLNKSSCTCHPPRHPALRNFAWKCLPNFLATKPNRLCNRSARSPYFNPHLVEGNLRSFFRGLVLGLPMPTPCLEEG